MRAGMPMTPDQLPTVDARAPTLVKSVCPLNCPDSCGILTEVQAGRVLRTTGDP
jgi:anaerobic selenocysteine-containing dehydrogenase